MTEVTQKESARQCEMGGETVFLYQLAVRERGSFTDGYVVVGITDDGVMLQHPSFDYDPFEVDEAKWEREEYRAVTTPNGTPVWGY